MLGMISKVEKLPDDVGKLKEIVAHSEAHIAILNGRIALLESRLFGPRNEKLKALNAQLEAAGQQSLFDLLDEHPNSIIAEPKVETIEVPAHARKKRGRKPLPDNLPREEVIHDIQGRLLLFFPGEFDNNNYRLLDARDGWNYLAVPITLHNGVSDS